mgnify:CR=1 FL=1
MPGEGGFESGQIDLVTDFNTRRWKKGININKLKGDLRVPLFFANTCKFSPHGV